MSTGKKILVTGAAGFIGSHTVVELVNSGYTPILVDNFSNSFPLVIKNLTELTGQELTFYNLDCNSYHDLEKLFSSEPDIEGIIHFAAYKAVGESVAEPLKYYDNNVGSLIKILHKMEEKSIKNLVFSSSCTVYGIPDELPVTEDTPTQPANSPYGNTKQICEAIIREHVAAQNPVKAISLRYFNPIGAHSTSMIGELPIGKPGNLVPYITQSVAGLLGPLTIFGDDYDTPDGSCIRDYIHVVDLAKAHVQSLSYLDDQTPDSFYDIFNLGTGIGGSVFEIVKAFESGTGEKLQYEVGPRRPGDVPAIYADVTKSKEILGWQTELSMEQALIDAWNWQKSLKEKDIISKLV